MGGLLAVAGLLVEAGLIEFFLRHLLTRPFYDDRGAHRGVGRGGDGKRRGHREGVRRDDRAT